MLASIAARRSRRAEALETLMADLPHSMSAGWAIVLDTDPRTHRIAASSAAPEDNGQELDSAPVLEARVLNPEQEDWKIGRASCRERGASTGGGRTQQTEAKTTGARASAA